MPYVLYMTEPHSSRHIQGEMVRAAFELHPGVLFQRVSDKIQETSELVSGAPASADEYRRRLDELQQTWALLRQRTGASQSSVRVRESEAEPIGALLRPILLQHGCRAVRCGGCRKTYLADDVREEKWAYSHGPLAAAGGVFWTCPRKHVLHWSVLFRS